MILKLNEIAPYISGVELETWAERLLRDYDTNLLLHPQEIPIEEIIENHFKLSLQYQYLSHDFSIAGTTIFEDGYEDVYDIEGSKYKKKYFTRGTILVDGRIADDPNKQDEMRLTCAHELIHWLLHQAYFQGLHTIKRRRIEWQAEYAAIALLSPLATLTALFAGYKERYELFTIVHMLAKDLGLPHKVVTKRLIEKRLVVYGDIDWIGG